ncbi:hypothetical protein D3C75_620700 [compost metagenome]
MVTICGSKEAHVDRSAIVVTAEVSTECHSQFVSGCEERTCRQWIRLTDVAEYRTVVSDENQAVACFTVRCQCCHGRISNCCKGGERRRHHQDARILIQFRSSAIELGASVVRDVFEGRGETYRCTESSKASVEPVWCRTFDCVVGRSQCIPKDQDLPIACCGLLRIGYPKDRIVQVLKRRCKLPTRVVEKLLQVGVTRCPSFSRRAVREVYDVLKQSCFDIAILIQNVDVTEASSEITCRFAFIRHRPLDERLTCTWSEVEFTVVPLVDRTHAKVLCRVDTDAVLVDNRRSTGSAPVAQ